MKSLYPQSRPIVARWSMWDRVGRTAALATGLAALLLGAKTARAAPATTERAPTDGVDRVYHDYSGEADASSLELNPALIGAVRGLDLSVMGYQTTNRFTRGSGFGAFVALNLGLGVGTAFGVQRITPGLLRQTPDFASDRNPAVTKLSWGLSGGKGEVASGGVAVHGIRSGGRWLQPPDIDVGVLTRITDYASLGLMTRLGPVSLQSASLPSQMSVIGEVSLRPLGTHHFEVAGGVKQVLLEAGAGDPIRSAGLEGLLGRGRLSVRYQGVAVRAEVEQVQTTVLDESTFAPVGQAKALRGSVSMDLSWDIASAGGGVHAGVAESGLDGVGFHARLHSRRRGRVFWPRQVDVQRIKISNLDDQRSLISMLEALERAREGGNRTILLVDARNARTGWASLHEVREALTRVRNAGGHVFAYLENTDLPSYYIASAAQKVFIHPAGALEAYGVSSRALYFSRALNKMGVQAEVVKLGEYKSAGERLSQDGPSTYDLAQRRELQSDVYDQVVYDIAKSRGLSLASVRALIDDAPYGPNEAMQRGLVDEIAHRDELVTEISDDLGVDVELEDIPDTSHQDETWSKTPYIGVVLVEDTIIDGESVTVPLLGLHAVGGDTIAEGLRELRDDRACKGIILRVNSPGGSALASEIIWREVARTNKAHEDDPKRSPPIVVSMGDVAASGGYYIAMGADTVLVDPMTITGSIGVIAVHFDLSGLLDKLGISVSAINSGKNADMKVLYKSFTDDQRKRMLASVKRVYGLFTQRVADGRGLPLARVEALGGGHVYSGTDAKDLGLADGFGGMHEAIGLLRREAKVAGFRKLEVRVVPREFRLLDLVFDRSSDPFAGAGSARNAIARRREAKRSAALAAIVPKAIVETLARMPLSGLFVSQSGVQAVMPYGLEVK